MNFSIQAIFACVAYVACWLGAITSGSVLAVDWMVYFSIWILFLALPMAIWDANIDRRPFWGGFFAIGIANLLLLFAGPSFSAQGWATAQPAPFLPATPAIIPGSFQVVESPAFPTALPAGFSPQGAPPTATSNLTSIAFGRLALFVSPILGGLAVSMLSRKRSCNSTPTNAR